jgi:hypothetical protein
MLFLSFLEPTILAANRQAKFFWQRQILARSTAGGNN